MAKFDCELFGHFFYGPELSYNDLLAREAELVDALHGALDASGGEHIDFTPTGDALRVQCVFAHHEETAFHAACAAVAPLLRDNVEGRMLFVDKGLDLLHLYLLADGVWQEAALRLPDARAGMAAHAHKDPALAVVPTTRPKPPAARARRGKAGGSGKTAAKTEG